MSKFAKTLMALFVVGIFVGFALDANATPYHYKQYLICYDCHTMHSSDSQGASATNPYSDGRNFYIAVDGTPHEYLLKGDGPNATCLNCHDGQTFAPDVFGANTNSYHRSAGALNGVVGAKDASADGYEHWMGHTLGSTEDAPGNSGVYTAGDLECISCHSQHGRADNAFRNLPSHGLHGFSSPTFVVSTTEDNTADAQINLASYTPGQGDMGATNDSDKYYAWENIVFHRDANGTNKVVSQICGACHTEFHKDDGMNGGGGTAGVGASGFLRHPTAVALIGQASGGGHSNFATWWNVDGSNHTRALANDQLTGGTTEASPFCLTCHKAHGNKNPFGLFFQHIGQVPGTNVPAGDSAEEGSDFDSTTQGFRNLCGNCHGQGRKTTGL